MEEGCTVAAGRRRSRAASTATRSSSKNGGSFIAAGSKRTPGKQGASRFALSLRIEWFRSQLAIGLFQKDFDAAFGFFKLLLALAREGDAFFEELHGVIQRKLRAFEAANHFFEAGE